MIDEKFNEIDKEYEPELDKIQKDNEALLEEAKKLQARVSCINGAKRKCINSIYNKKLAFAQDYINKEILTMQPPTKWDFKRVCELRMKLAHQISSTADGRADALKTLQELKLYVTNFPVVKRVAELLKTWTSSNIITTDSKAGQGQYPDGLALYVNGQGPLLRAVNNRWYYRDWRNNGRESISYALLKYRDSDWYEQCGYVEFWELLCDNTKLSAEYLAGVHGDATESEHDKRCEYYNILRQIGTQNGYNPGDKFEYSTDAELAARIMAYSYTVFNVNDIITPNPKIKESIIADGFGDECVDKVYKIISSPRTQISNTITNTINTLKLENLGTSSFSEKSCAVVWAEHSDGDMVFNPDTCEMIHKHGTQHIVKLDNVLVKDIKTHLVANIPELTKLGVVYGMIYLSKHTGLGDDGAETYESEFMTNKNRRVLLDKELSEFGTISELTKNNGHWKELNFTIALKVPKEKFTEKYKDYEYGKTRDGDVIYRFHPVFDDNKHIIGITAKKPKRR